MKLVQKILSHGLLIAFFIAVFFLYLYRQSLFPQWFGTESQSVARHSESTQQERAAPEQAPASAVAERPQGMAGAAVDPAAEAGTTDLPPLARADAGAPTDDSLPPMAGGTEPSQAVAPDDTGPAQAADAQQAPGNRPGDLPPPADTRMAPQYRPLAEPASDTSTGTDVTSTSPQAPTGTTQTTPATAPQRAQQQPSAAATAEDASPQYRPLQQQRREPPESYRTPQAAERGTAYPSAVAPPSAPDTEGAAQAVPEFRAGLAQARETFWNGDLRGAEMSYRNLVETWPEQADGWGELGNLYLTLDQRAMAADAYYKATGLLIDHGETLRAQHVLRMLYGLDAEKASELEQRMRQSGG